MAQLPKLTTFFYSVRFRFRVGQGMRLKKRETGYAIPRLNFD